MAINLFNSGLTRMCSGNFIDTANSYQVRSLVALEALMQTAGEARGLLRPSSHPQII